MNDTYAIDLHVVEWGNIYDDQMAWLAGHHQGKTLFDGQPCQALHGCPAAHFDPEVRDEVRERQAIVAKLLAVFAAGPA